MLVLSGEAAVTCMERKFSYRRYPGKCHIVES